MENSKTNIKAYIQAAISFLLILCTFLPYSDSGESLCYMLGMQFKIPLIGFLFIVYFMLHVLNIFLQSRKYYNVLPIVLGVIGLIALVIIDILLDTEGFPTAFALILILLFAQLLTSFYMIRTEAHTHATHDLPTELPVNNIDPNNALDGVSFNNSENATHVEENSETPQTEKSQEEY